jgi:hypothetical protein
LFEAQPAQPRRYVHAVILDSEEPQPLMNEDIPLHVDLPAAELKEAQCRVSGLRAVNDRFRRVDLTGRPNREDPKPPN